jgi:hypothetical protein
VKSVLGGLRFWDRHEQEAGKAVLGGADLKLAGVVVDDYPAERFSPPLPERARVACIDDRLLPDQGHELDAGMDLRTTPDLSAFKTPCVQCHRGV